MSAPSCSVLILGYVGHFAHHLIDCQRRILCVARLHRGYRSRASHRSPVCARVRGIDPLGCQFLLRLASQSAFQLARPPSHWSLVRRQGKRTAQTRWTSNGRCESSNGEENKMSNACACLLSSRTMRQADCSRRSAVKASAAASAAWRCSSQSAAPWPDLPNGCGPNVVSSWPIRSILGG